MVATSVLSKSTSVLYGNISVQKIPSARIRGFESLLLEFVLFAQQISSNQGGLGTHDNDNLASTRVLHQFSDSTDARTST